LVNFIERTYPEIRSDILKFVYAPDCYHKFSDSKSKTNYIDILNSTTTEEFSESGGFLTLENLHISSLSDHNNLVRFLIVLENCPENLIEEISEVFKEIQEIFSFVSIQADANSASNTIKTANLVSRISHDINSLIALIPKDFTKDEALTTRINYSEILSREIMYYLRELTVEKSKVPVEDLFSGIISGIEFPSNVSFSKKYNDTFEKIAVDVELMDRALTAIFDNAVFATQIEGGCIEMTLSIRRNISPFIVHDWLEIIVKDTGPGIAIEFLNDVKKPFFTTWKDQGHVGLGLSITNNIILAHHGHFSIESESNQGTKTIIHLPMR
jgi:signal transduction histidine kinase